MNKESKKLESVGDRVRKIRLWQHLTQKQFAVKIGYGGDNPDRAIHYIEIGERPLPMRKLHLINDLFEVNGLNPDYLLLKSDFMTYEELRASLLVGDSLRAKQVSEAIEILLKEAAFRAGFNTDYESKEQQLLNYHFKNFKSFDFCPTKGLVWSFRFDDDLIDDFKQDLLGYAEYQFMRMITKRLPEKKEGK